MPTTEMTDQGHQQWRWRAEFGSRRLVMTWMLSSGEERGMCRSFQDN